MSKMGLHDPFGHLKHKLWPKEGSGVKWPIWLPTTKSQELPWLSYVQVAWHIPLESSQQGLQLCFRPHLNQKFGHKDATLQSFKSPNFGNFGTPRTKWHLGASPVARHKVYYKGGRWWLPSSLGRDESCEPVFACDLSMHQRCSSTH
jgi:hypothetical protein